MNSSMTEIVRSSANYSIVAPMSMVFAMIAVIISSFILILVSFTKQLHTVTHFLTSNTCIASIIYCLVQCCNYIFLLFITSDTSNQSCRWRGYFGYMSIVAVIYSYLLQAISRFFFTILSAKYRWLTSLKIHIYLIIIGWIVILILPLPALITNDIYFRAGFLCWVPKNYMLHIAYTIVAYYLIPIILIISIYISIYVHTKFSMNNYVFAQRSLLRRKQRRDLEVFRVTIILFSIYIFGAIPSIFYMLTGVEFFYSIGIVSVSFTVTVEKVVSIFLIREIRTVLTKYFCQQTRRIAPIVERAIPLY